MDTTTQYLYGILIFLMVMGILWYLFSVYSRVRKSPKLVKCKLCDQWVESGVQVLIDEGYGRHIDLCQKCFNKSKKIGLID